MTTTTTSTDREHRAEAPTPVGEVNRRWRKGDLTLVVTYPDGFLGCHPLMGFDALGRPLMEGEDGHLRVPEHPSALVLGPWACSPEARAFRRKVRRRRRLEGLKTALRGD